MDEAENQINDLEHKEAKNNQSEPEEEKGIRKNEDSSDILIIGGPEGEEKEQEIRNLFEKIMKENLPNLVKKQTCKSRKHRESKQDGYKRAHSKTHHN